MANIKISQLTEWTGNTLNGYSVWNNSGETTTYKTKNFNGLVSGIGVDSIKSADWLTPTYGPALANGLGSIAIGSQAEAPNGQSVAIGWNVTATNDVSFAYGASCNATGLASVMIGYAANSTAAYSIFIGQEGNASGTESIGIGRFNNSTGLQSISLGASTTSETEKSTAIGVACLIRQSTFSNILGGYDNGINTSNGIYNNIIGGEGNRITGTTSGTTLIGLRNYTQPLNSDTAYVNKFYVIGQQIDFPSGSGKIGGTGNTISATGNDNMILSSSGSTISGSNVNHSNIVGGKNNTLTAALGSSVIGGQDHQLFGQWSGIFAGRKHINNSNYSVCLGGRENDITSTSSEHCGMLAGFQNINSSTGKYNVMIGGFNSTVTGGTNIVTLALTGRTGLSQDNTTYAENVHAFRTYSTTVQPISSGTTFTCDLNNGGKAQYSLTGNTTIDITNVRDGQSFMVKTQTNGNYTITWTATGYTFEFEGGTKDPGNTTKDIFVFEVFGTTIYGNRRHNYS